MIYLLGTIMLDLQFHLIVNLWMNQSINQSTSTLPHKKSSDIQGGEKCKENKI